MAYYPKDRNPSGIVFFGRAGSDQLLESSSAFYYNTGNSTVYATTFNGALVGNASTATLALDASGLTSSITIQLSNQLSGSATFQDAGNTANISATLTTASVTGQTTATSGNNSDFLLIASGTELRRITRANFLAGLGSGTGNMSSWNLSANSGSVISITDGTNVDFTGAGSITITRTGSQIRISGVDQNNTYVAGSGLTESPSLTFNVQTDNSTLEVSSDIVRVKDFGIVEAKRGRTINSSYSNNGTINADINLVAATGLTDFLVNLPAAASGKMIYVKKTDANAGRIQIDQAASETIDGGTAYYLYNQYETVILICDGTNWHVF